MTARHSDEIRLWMIGRTALLVALLTPLSLHAQSTYSAYESATATPAFSVQSPYSSPSKTRQLLNTVAIHVLLFLDYTEQEADAGTWKTVELPGIKATRYFTKGLAGGSYRTVEMAVSPHPQGDHEYYVYGLEISPDGTQQPNPDLPYIQSSLETLVQTIQAKQQSPEMQELSYQIYHLSYIQSDRALALLKSLGYTVVEYAEQAGESVYDRIYSPVQSAEWKLPVVIKLIDATKTSLMDPSPSGTAYTQQAQTYSSVSDLGGTFLHQMTSGEPQQRLLIVYNKYDPEPIEALLNMLRDMIDMPARQIVIEALVIEINTDKMKELGLAIGGSKNRFGASFNEKGAEGAPQPFAFVFGQNSASDLFGNIANAFGDFFSFRTTIEALVESGDAEVLSSPSVLVLDGRQARIQVGQQVPVVKSTATAAGFTQSVDYFPVGIVLNLRPRISEDGSEVTMQVETIVSSVNEASSGQAGAGSDVLVAPRVDNRQVQTFVRVADNTPFIIGGLISTDRRERTVGIPILSRIPILGWPFRRKAIANTKKEVIVVLTPHVVPIEDKSFSYVIPKDSNIFDSFGNQLFRNAYRIRDDDVFDLRFIYESTIFHNLLARIRDRSEEDPSLKTAEPFSSLLNGAVPGEETLVRRMLWEIVYKTDFAKNIDVGRIILFEDQPSAPDSSGFRTAFLNRLLAGRDGKTKNALVLKFDARFRGTVEHPFVQPKAMISLEGLPPDAYLSRLMEGNRRLQDGSPNQWTILLSEINPTGVRGATALEVLQGVLVLQRILALNRTLPLTVKEFRVGRQIIFPTEQDLQQRFHIIDRDAARFYYEVVQYYPEFEKEFNRRTRHITAILDDTEG